MRTTTKMMTMMTTGMVIIKQIPLQFLHVSPSEKDCWLVLRENIKIHPNLDGFLLQMRGYWYILVLHQMNH